MPKVLTMKSSFFCDAKILKTDEQGKPVAPSVFLHGGEVTKQSSTKLTVKQEVVLLKSINSITPTNVTGCQIPLSPATTKPCTTAIADKGEATKLTVNDSQGALLERSLEATDGNLTGTIPGTAEQDKLTATWRPL